MRSNLGVELDLANHDRSASTMEENARSGLMRDIHPNGSMTAAERVRNVGEIKYNQERLARAIRWIQEHPWRFVELSLARARLFWLGDRQTGSVFALGTMLAVAGLWFLWRTENHHALRIFGVVWICYPLTYYVIQYVPRYRIPIWWTVVLLAAYGGGQLVSSWRAGGRERWGAGKDDLLW